MISTNASAPLKTLETLLSHSAKHFSDCFISPEPNVDVRIVFGLRDLVDFSSQRFIIECMQAGSGPLRYRHGHPAPLDERIRGCMSLSDGRVVRVTEGGSGSVGSDKNQVFLELWEGQTRLLRLLVPGYKDIHFGGLFGSPVLSSCKKYVILIGEPSDSKFPRGCWGDDGGNYVFGKQDAKFSYRPDFGENMTKYKSPKIIILNIETHEFSNVDLGGLKIHPAFPAPLPDSTTGSFLFVGYSADSRLHMPGLSRCFNRKSSIYRLDNPLDASPEISCLTEGIYMGLCPAITEDGRMMVFAGSKEFFPEHCTELSLYQVDLSSNAISEIPLDKIRDDTCVVPTFNGVCLSSQSESAFIRFLPDNKTLLVPSFSSGKHGIFLIDVDSKDVIASIFPPIHSEVLSSVTILGSRENSVVFVHQGFTTLRSVWLARIETVPNGSPHIEYVELINPPKLSGVFSNLGNISVIRAPNCPAWLIKTSSFGNESTRKPLIAYLHGGPHMMAVNQYSIEIANFIASGYDVVIPNYRGSLSFGKSFLRELVGNAGSMDVQDCHDCVIQATKLLNPSIVIAFGGSHGGFLTAWLLGNPDTKSTYAAGVLWNPAVDLVSSNLTSDIPEWALSQVLNDKECTKESAFAPSIDFFVKAAQRSPMSVVRNVTAPSLVLLGSSDKRVCPSAGLRWAQAVETNGGTTQVLWFPEQGHAISGAELYETAIASIAVWIREIANTIS